MKTKLVLTGVMLSLIYITCGGGGYRGGGDGDVDDLAAAIADFEDWLDEIDGAENCTEKFDIFMIGDTSSSDDVNLEIVDSTSSGCAGPYSDLFTAYSMFIEVGEELENEGDLESGEIPDVLCDYIDDFTDAVRELIEEECFGIVTDEDPPNDCVEDCAGIWDGNNICGCTDSTATNYDSTATFDDESCEYPTEVTLWNVVYSVEDTETLNLSNRELTGSIPPEIGNLTNLTWLWLYDNQLTGEIPESICDLNINWGSSNYFNISYNQLCTPYPSCIEDYVGEQDTSDCP
jgi:hypothetical protein